MTLRSYWAKSKSPMLHGLSQPGACSVRDFLTGDSLGGAGELSRPLRSSGVNFQGPPSPSSTWSADNASPPCQSQVLSVTPRSAMLGWWFQGQQAKVPWVAAAIQGREWECNFKVNAPTLLSVVCLWHQSAYCFLSLPSCPAYTHHTSFRLQMTGSFFGMQILFI